MKATDFIQGDDEIHKNGPRVSGTTIGTLRTIEILCPCTPPPHPKIAFWVVGTTAECSVTSPRKVVTRVTRPVTTRRTQLLSKYARDRGRRRRWKDNPEYRSWW